MRSAEVLSVGVRLTNYAGRNGEGLRSGHHILDERETELQILDRRKLHKGI
jgi:hypothetical protein